jgi:hypothetical protein
MDDGAGDRIDHALTASTRRSAITLLIVLAILLVVGSALVDPLSTSFADPDAQFDDVHSSQSTRIRLIAGGAMLLLAALTALPAVATIIMRTPVSEWRAPQLCGFGFALLFSALIIASGAAYATVAASRELGGVFDDTGQFQTGAWVLPQLGTVFYIAAGVAASATIISVASMLRPPHRRLTALRIGGGVAALLLPLSFAVPPLMGLLPLWLLFVVLTSDTAYAQRA